MAGTKLEKETVMTTIHVFPDDWEVFKELHGDRKASARLRELMRKDIIALTAEEVKAQSLAGLTEA